MLAEASTEAALRLGLAEEEEPELLPEGVGERGRPADACVWSSMVRATDCDSLGHVNNAKYALLAAEARAYAAHTLGEAVNTPLTGGFAKAAPCVFSCDYLGQPLPFQALEVAVWSESPGVLSFDVTRPGYEEEDEGPVATMTMSLHEPPPPTASL